MVFPKTPDLREPIENLTEKELLLRARSPNANCVLRPNALRVKGSQRQDNRGATTR